jgi:uncharacterized membrane protein
VPGLVRRGVGSSSAVEHVADRGSDEVEATLSADEIGEPEVGTATDLMDVTEVTDEEPVTTWAATKAVLFRYRHGIVLGLLSWWWFWTFFQLGALRHDRFGTFGFDLGIFDQAAWLVAHFRDPFMTVRGLDVWGHHGNFVFILFAPFYWLGAGPKFLLAVQLLGQVAGAIGVYLLARDRLKDRWLGVALAAAMFLHPTMQFLAWEFFHPETLAIGPMVLAYWAARAGRWKLFWVMAVLAMSCKEDVTFFFIMLGIVLVIRKQPRMGAWVAGVATAWYLAVTQILIPLRNPAGPFYEEHFFSNYGGSVPEVIKTVITNPSQLWKDLNDRGRVAFYVKLWAPVAFVCFLSPTTMLLGVPTFFIVVMASLPWVQDYRFHYMAILLAATFVAVVEGVANLRRVSHRYLAVGAVVAAAMFGSAMWGASPFSRQWDDGYWPRARDESYLEILFGRERNDDSWPGVATKQAAVNLVPGDASVSAVYTIVPHVSGRAYAYEWPNPWIGTNWGICNDNLDDPATVDWLLVDRSLLGNQVELDLLDRLLLEEFEVRLRDGDMVAAERVRPPAFPAGPGITECGR